METNKRWQFWIIIAVLLLTLYNILPTIFFYTKPLRTPIDEERAHRVAEEIVDRVNGLEKDSEDWLWAFSKNLGLSMRSVTLDKNDARRFTVVFDNAKDAETFKAYLPRAGSLIPFVPAQLEPSGAPAPDDKTVLVERRVGIHFTKENIPEYFHFSPMTDDHKITDFYKGIVYDRVAEIGVGFAGPSYIAKDLAYIATASPRDPNYNDALLNVAKIIVTTTKTLGTDHAVTKRVFASFTASNDKDPQGIFRTFAGRLDTLKNDIDAQRDRLRLDREKLLKDGKLLDPVQEQNLTLLDDRRSTLETASSLLKQQGPAFQAGLKPLSRDDIMSLLAKGSVDASSGKQNLDITGHNPFIKTIVVDWTDNTIELLPYEDIIAIRNSQGTTEAAAYLKDKLSQMVINEIARVSRIVDEKIVPDADSFFIAMDTLTDSTSILAFNLGSVAQISSQQLQTEIASSWLPTSQDFQRKDFPINSWKDFSALPAEENRLGLVVYAPSMFQETPPSGFRTSSIYIIARGVGSIAKKYEANPNTPEAKAFQADLQALNALLQRNGFIGYAGDGFGISDAYSNDFIFEKDDYYTNILTATRENFSVHGSRRYAILDFTDVEQRILTANKIDDSTHEALLKWKEEFQQAQVDLNPTSRLMVPPPPKNVYWDNFKLSTVKYFRGDEKKVLRWGLDLSGGKTVRIGLRDKNQQTVTNKDELNQAVNELYGRINKMGVAERTIRIENNNIILEFPGSQGFSANELVKASAMYFHIVNEKFGVRNNALGDAANKFLQEVWNEAVVTNRKDAASINEIAWQHLGGGDENSHSRGEWGQLLYDNGLRLAAPNTQVTTAFDDTLSSIARFRGDDYSGWYGQAHPLLIVFHNNALDGSSLDNIHTGYDQREGNMLMFGVKRSYEGAQTGSPRDDFYAWTSQFAEDRIMGTPKEQATNGHGWRMAVILNDEIVSWPVLKAALRDGGTISGRFTQREVTRLAADLKAGSLSFTPKVLSEQNVSPELGREERSKGIFAALVGTLSVIAVMVYVYRFAGLIASIAVVFNLLIIWGVLQNLGGALTMPGIAAMVLTIGMAVDANVLVFERTREELAVSGRIASALGAGYRKAFSAIIDSNLVIVLAALILAQFDSGPIKGFAVILIIGIISAMFTGLFCTRHYFAHWVKGGKDRTLHFVKLLGHTSFDFFKMAKPAIICSLILIVIGTYLLVAGRKTIFGMDFTGGYSLTLNVKEQVGENYRLKALSVLTPKVPSPNDVQVRELSRPNQLKIQLSVAMEQPHGAFYGLPDELTEGAFQYSYQRNPRLLWLVDTLQRGGLEVQDSELASLDKGWTVMSGQFSDAMRNNAIMALAAAILGILVYITLRFEFIFGMSAVIGLIHDTLLTLGIIAILHWFGVGVQIDLQVVGAIMTVIGYSLNDTIIVFDRIREDLRLMRKMSFPELVNHAMNITLSRTIMTVGITLLVLLALVTLGGSSIFTFSLVMTIGVAIGTLSSLFIAAPMLLFFHNREEAKLEHERALKMQKA